jgi:hypothetical protein
MDHPREVEKRREREKARLEGEVSREVIKTSEAANDLIKFVQENSKKDMLVVASNNPYVAKNKEGCILS